MTSDFITILYQGRKYKVDTNTEGFIWAIQEMVGSCNCVYEFISNQFKSERIHYLYDVCKDYDRIDELVYEYNGDAIEILNALEEEGLVDNEDFENFCTYNAEEVFKDPRTGYYKLFAEIIDRYYVDGCRGITLKSSRR